MKLMDGKGPEPLKALLDYVTPWTTTESLLPVSCNGRGMSSIPSEVRAYNSKRSFDPCSWDAVLFLSTSPATVNSVRQSAAK